MKALLGTFLVICVIWKNTEAVTLDEVFAWSIPEFAWPDATTKSNAITSGAYIPENNIPLGLCRWNDKLFITVPR